MQTAPSTAAASPADGCQRDRARGNRAGEFRREVVLAQARLAVVVGPELCEAWERVEQFCRARRRTVGTYRTQRTYVEIGQISRMLDTSTHTHMLSALPREHTKRQTPNPERQTVTPL